MASGLEQYRAEVVLRDGSVLTLRAIQPEDEERLLAFFYRLNRQTVYLRFYHTMKELSREEARRFCTVDYDTSLALVAITGKGIKERIIAVGRYYRFPARNIAEVAFVVEDVYQGKGIGTHLLIKLAAVAREKGINAFEALVLAENEEMLAVFGDSGFPMTTKLEQDVFRVTLDITKTPEGGGRK